MLTGTFNKLFLKNFDIIFVNKLITFFFHKNVKVNFETFFKKKYSLTFFSLIKIVEKKNVTQNR